MPASGNSLVDANVWLALAVDAHVHHAGARRWFAVQAEASSAFCRLTQLALLRHLTNENIMGVANVQTQEQAWRTYQALAADPRTVYLDEPPGLTAVFKSLSQTQQPAQKQWSDAYLAAFATCLGLELVTFDADFNRFPSLRVQRLTG